MAIVEGESRQHYSKLLLLIPILISVVVACIIFYPKNQEETKSEYIDELQAAYQEQGITLSSEDVQVRNGAVEVTNQDKANEYVKKINAKINTIYKKYTNNHSSSSNTGETTPGNDSSNNDDDQDDSGGTNVNFLLELARKKLTDLNSLWFYFDNSKYIDMNTGETYDYKYQKEMSEYEKKQNDAYNKAYELVKSEHSDWNDDEIDDYIVIHYDEFNFPNRPTEYDESMIDIDKDQINKAYGLLCACNKYTYTVINDATRNLYIDSFGTYCVLNDINATNEERMSYSDSNAPFYERLSKQVYLNIPEFDASSAIVNEVQGIYYNDHFYEAIMQIKTGDTIINYSIADDNFIVLDIS